ncbi:MAG: invasion associated locus B family protein [Hyphomicrobiales bacterium]
MPLFTAAIGLVLLAPVGEFSALAQQQTQQPQTRKAPPPGPRVQTLQQLQRLQQQRQAQGGQRQAPPPPDVVAAHGKWQVQCENAPTSPQQSASGKSNKADPLTAGATAAQPQQAAKPARQCGMVQVTQAPERKGVNLSLILGRTKQGDKDVTMMRIMVPIGVYLPLGIALEVDGAPVGRVPFIRCLPQACMALAEATPETLGKMRKGSVANFIIYEAPGVGVTLPISLEGFTKSIEALNKT